jgi:hypothetical protein
MKKFKPLLKKLKDQKGVAVILVAVGILVFLFFVALAIDIGYAVATKNQLQNVADSAALAGARKVGQIYNGLTYEEQQELFDGGGVLDSSQQALVRESAKAVALQNEAGGKNIVIDDADIVIGHWEIDPTSPTYLEVIPPTIYKPTDAVSVIARRDSTQNSPLTTFFAKTFGVNTVSLASRHKNIMGIDRPATTAALSGPSTIPPSSSPGTGPTPPTPPTGGGDIPPLPIPVGISKAFFEGKSGNEICGDTIKFHPTGTSSCAGWNTYDTKPASDSKERKIMEDLLAGTYQTPEVKVNQTKFYFTGGTLSTNTFIAFDNLFQYMKTHDGDGKDDVWTAAVVVYDFDCGNPNKDLTIVGLATVEISEVGAAPNKEVYGKILCNYVYQPATPPGSGTPGTPGTPGGPSHGGGQFFQTYASIPGLVE